MVEPTYSIFEIAAGAGMLGTGLTIALEALGIGARIVGGCEWEATAATAFLASLEHSQGGGVPVWDDANTFLGRRARGLERVDAITAGYPCQPFSSAGKRLGKEDVRHLWPAVRRIVARLQPRIVFFENVDGHVTKGLRKVLRDTERLGYRVTCGVFSAEEVGSPHLRKRVFIVGQRAADAGCGDGVGDSEHGRPESLSGQPGSRRRSTRPDGRCNELGDPEHGMSWGGEPRQATRPEQRSGLGEGITGGGEELAIGEGGGFGTLRESSECDRQSERSDDELADRNSQRRQQDTGRPPCDENQNGREGWDGNEPNGSDEFIGGIPIFPPHRDAYDRWAQLAADGLDPTLMPAIESGVSVVADGMATPADLLRLGGNGVVPLQAAWAFINLFACLMDGMETGERRQLDLFD